MKSEEIKKIIAGDRNCNFIAIVVTVMQANGVDAAIEYLREKGITPKGYVLVIPHEYTGRLVTKNSFHNTGSNVKVVELQDNILKNNGFLKKIFLKLYPFIDVFLYRLDRVGRPRRYIVKPSIPIMLIWTFGKGYGLKFIDIDDGGGSYVPEIYRVHDWAYYDTRGKGSLYQKFMIWIKTLFFMPNEIICKIIRNQHRVIDLRIYAYEPKKCRFHLNKVAADAYKKVYRMEDTDLSFTREWGDKYILLTGQCLKENKITDGTQELKLYEPVIRYLQSRGYKVVVKPHPRELEPEWYLQMGCILFNNRNISMEALLSNVEVLPAMVVSIFSSTLLNASKMFEIPAISLALIFKSLCRDDYTRYTMDSYARRYRDTLFIPGNMEELKEYVRDMESCSQRDSKLW